MDGEQRQPKPPKPCGRNDRNPERDAEIYAKRKAGRTLRSLGEEYALHHQRIRDIAITQERLERERACGYEGLSTRALYSIRIDAADRMGRGRSLGERRRPISTEPSRAHRATCCASSVLAARLEEPSDQGAGCAHVQ